MLVISQFQGQHNMLSGKIKVINCLINKLYEIQMPDSAETEELIFAESGFANMKQEGLR